ncbi:hypothetical protein BDV36DRAFT_290741 [Aspergillus pseudocaelatus]|uniref:Uncharacterized protein n=1 Tax=Aspergillus pseudocaelatus TaxID=1825620 RepID=A0ABQ6X443_9EURO|nr:hypothetical protein BDV36DRAFT_290741 [Aspergillus pseudocaelatus]
MEVMFKKIDNGDARQFVSEGEKQALGQLDLSGKGNIIATHVTSSKIRNARGTREKYPSQEQVMGTSATAWLHRSAYSWGGLGGQNPGTSQIFRNLVFGTSECNSIMTRYEEAFKALIEREADAKRYQNGDWGGGGILVTDIKKDMYRPKFAGGEEHQPEYFRNNGHSWLCCAMDYILYVNCPDARMGHSTVPIKKPSIRSSEGFSLSSRSSWTKRSWMNSIDSRTLLTRVILIIKM